MNEALSKARKYMTNTSVSKGKEIAGQSSSLMEERVVRNTSSTQE